MNARRRAVSAALLSLALVLEFPICGGSPGVPFASRASAQGRLHPVRVLVREPARRTARPSLLKSAVRGIASTNVRPLYGTPGAAPPMLRPPFKPVTAGDPDGSIASRAAPGRARAFAALATPAPAVNQCVCGVCPQPSPTPAPAALHRTTHPAIGAATCAPAPTPTPVVTPTPAATPTPTPTPAITPTPSPTPIGSTPSPTSSPTQSSLSGTGINPWWRYREENVPGGGHLMVNVGTGNLLLQDDDMTVPHKGIALAFRRTYNSQSGHDVAGSDGSRPAVRQRLDQHVRRARASDVGRPRCGACTTSTARATTTATCRAA